MQTAGQQHLFETDPILYDRVGLMRKLILKNHPNLHVLGNRESLALIIQDQGGNGGGTQMGLNRGQESVITNIFVYTIKGVFIMRLAQDQLKSFNRAVSEHDQKYCKDGSCNRNDSLYPEGFGYFEEEDGVHMLKYSNVLSDHMVIIDESTPKEVERFEGIIQGLLQGDQGDTNK